MKRIALACAIAALSAPLAAQDYPNRPIRIIVPFVAGGTTDVLARIIGQEFTRTFGQNVIVENRAGGGGVVGTSVMTKATPDGYTIGIIVSSHAVNPGLHSKLPYDSANDVVPISLLLRVPNVLAVHPAQPARTFAEFVQWAKDNPGKQVYGSSGAGTAAHLSGELIGQMLNARLTHVPYRGGATAIQDLIAGQLPASIHNVNNILPLQKTGRVRSLMVTGAKRSPVMPDVPAAAETIPGYEIIEWYGMVGPRGIPREVVRKLQAEISRMLNEPALRNRWLNEQGAEMVGGTPEEFAAFLKAELDRWPPFVRKMGIRID